MPQRKRSWVTYDKGATDPRHGGGAKAMFSAKVEGIQQTNKMLAELEAESRAMIYDAINKGVRTVYVQAKALVPVDTGELKGRIDKYEASEYRGKYFVSGKVYVDSKDDSGDRSWRKQVKARIVEFGSNKIDYLPQPFLLEVMRLTYNTHRNRIRRAVRTAIKQANAKRGRGVTA